jgi:hypothetical protein
MPVEIQAGTGGKFPPQKNISLTFQLTKLATIPLCGAFSASFCFFSSAFR